MDEQAHLFELCGGNAHAVALIRGAWKLAEVWDDCIDGEKNESDQAIDEAFCWALFGLSDNVFFQQHRMALRPAFMQAIAGWRAANQLERSSAADNLHTAYVLRCAPYQFFIAVVLAANGIEAATKAAVYFYGRPTADSLEAYMAEHLNRKEG